MAIQYPQRYDDDFINTIKKLIDHVNEYGKTLQELVVDGQLTEEQYVELLTTINGLVKSGHVDKSDLSPEFKDEIEGFSVQLAQTGEDINKIESDVVQLESDVVQLESRKADQDYVQSELDKKATRDELDSGLSGKLSKVTRQDLDDSNDENKWDLNDFNESSRQAILENNEVDLNYVLGESAVIEENLANGAATSYKKSNLGDMGVLLGTVPIEVTLTPSKKKLVFKSGTYNYSGSSSNNLYYIHHKRGRYSITPGTEVSLNVTGSSLGFLYLDASESTESNPVFKVVTGTPANLIYTIDESYVLLAIFRTDAPVFNAIGNFTINGVTNYNNGIKQAKLTRTINFDTTNKTIQIPSQYLWCGGYGTGDDWYEAIVSKTLDFTQKLNEGKSFFGIVFNNRTKEFSIKDLDNSTFTFNEFLVGTFNSNNWSHNQLRQASINGHFTIDGADIFMHGDNAHLRNELRIDTVNKTATIPQQRIVTRKDQVDVSTTVIDLDYTKSYFLIYYDFDVSDFGVQYSRTETLTNNQYIVASWFKGLERRASVNGAFTVNGLNNNEHTFNSMAHTKDDSIYSWWVHPLTTRYKGLRDKTYIGYTDSKGGQGVMSVDNKTGHIERKLLRLDDINDHNALSVTVMQDGRLLVVGAGHNSTDYNHIFISKNPESVLEFEDEIRLPLHEGYKGVAYAQVLYVGGEYHLFFRCGYGDNNSAYWGYRKSSDGETWSDAKIFVTGESVQYYVKAVKQDDSTIKLALTSNTWLNETDIRFGYLDTVSGDIKNFDGTVLANIDTLTEPINFTEFDVVVDKGDKNLRLLDVSEGEETAIAYCSYTGDNVATNHIAYLNDGNVTVVDLPESPGTSFGANIRYHNGIAFIDAHTIAVSRNLGDKWVIEKYSNEGTGNFSLDETLSESDNPDIKLMRPTVADNDPEQVFWNRGYYDDDDWTKFYTDIDGTVFIE